MRTSSLLIAATLSLGLGTAAQAVSLSTLLSGGTLVQGDATFENFFFEDVFDTEDLAEGDRVVSADQIDIDTSATANSVSLIVNIDPEISIPTVDTSVFPNIFGFLLDFDVTISASSPRQFIGASLTGGDLFATGDGRSGIFYLILGNSGTMDLAIFEVGSTATSIDMDSTTFTAINFISFQGDIVGDTGLNGTAGLSTFTLTFDLQGTAPPDPAVIPLPAGLPLLLAGLGTLALVRRRKG